MLEKLKESYNTNQLIKAEEAIKFKLDALENALIRQETIKYAYDMFLTCLNSTNSISKIVVYQHSITLVLDETSAIDIEKLQELFQKDKLRYNKFLITFGFIKRALSKERHIYINCNDDIFTLKGGLKIKTDLMKTRCENELFPHINTYIYIPKENSFKPNC